MEAFDIVERDYTIFYWMVLVIDLKLELFSACIFPVLASMLSQGWVFSGLINVETLNLVIHLIYCFLQETELQ